MRTKHTGYAVRSLGVLGAIGVATLLGGCDTSTTRDAPAELGTTPANSDSTATIPEATVSIPEIVSTPAAGDENEPDENEPDENEPDENEPDENEPDENEPDENEPDEAGDR